MEEELEEAEANVVDPNFIAYIEAPAWEFDNASKWTGVVGANRWTPYNCVPIAEDGFLYKARFTVRKGRSFMPLTCFP